MEAHTSIQWPDIASTSRQPSHLRPGARGTERVGSDCSAAVPGPLAVHNEGQAIRLVGEVDLATCQTLQTALDALVARPAGDVVVDCSEVTFFGAAGVDALVRARNQLDSSRRLVIRKPSAIVRRVLGIVHLTELFADVTDNARNSTVAD
jgi:anti-anti-sigma factor